MVSTKDVSAEHVEMKLSLVIIVLVGALLALASLFATPLAAAPQDQDQLAATSGANQPTLQTWRHPSIIEDLKNIEFDFDSHDLTSEQLSLGANAQWLKSHPSVRVRLSGYTDPRGDIVHNLALSHRRAESVKEQLVRMGIAENRIEFATGWGKLYPNCLESTEECWKLNRRVEFLRAIE
jgi:outer membrane protein OmpA-like peptidoglycan-associated protein